MGQSFANWKKQGELTLRWLQFENDGEHETRESTGGIFSRIETTHKTNNGQYAIKIIAESDGNDKNQGRIEVEEASLSRLFSEKKWKISAGQKIFNWTTMEVFSPADSVNSRYYGIGSEHSHKLGELSFELERSFSNFTLSFYFFPYFRAPRLSIEDYRMGGEVTLKDSVIMGTGPLKREGQRVTQGGLRLTGTWKGIDWGGYYLRHIDRKFHIVGASEYTFSPYLERYMPENLSAMERGEVTAYYFDTNEFGMSMVKGLKSILLKMEAVQRRYSHTQKIYSIREQDLRGPRNHSEVAIGLEYPFDFNFFMETSLIVESSGIFGVDKDARKEMSIFQRDLFIGSRHSFNDIMGKELRWGLIFDLEGRKENAYTASYSQRLNDGLKINIGIRAYHAPQKETVPYGMEIFDGHGHAYLSLTKFF